MPLPRTHRRKIEPTLRDLIGMYNPDRDYAVIAQYVKERTIDPANIPRWTTDALIVHRRNKKIREADKKLENYSNICGVCGGPQLGVHYHERDDDA